MKNSINVLDYEKLAIKFANKYRKYDIEDGIQDGYEALILSKKTFNKNLGYKFITYVYKRVMGHVYYKRIKRKQVVFELKHHNTYEMDQKILLIPIDKILSKREKNILIDVSVNEIGLTELSKRYKISNQRIHQIYKDAIKKSKEYIQQEI